jgi:hypothetical protein
VNAASKGEWGQSLVEYQARAIIKMPTSSHMWPLCSSAGDLAWLAIFLAVAVALLVAPLWWRR